MFPGSQIMSSFLYTSPSAWNTVISFSLRHKSQSHKEKSDLYDLLKIKYCHGHHKVGQNTMGEQQTLFALFPVHKGEHP